MCAAYGQYGHQTEEKTVLVGNACPEHDGGSPRIWTQSQLKDEGMIRRPKKQ